jgi:hypothetical protein
VVLTVDRRHGAEELVQRLKARWEEIEQAVLTRIWAVQDPVRAGDPQYEAGLRAAVSAAIGYGLAGIEATGQADSARIPEELLRQARHAARSGVRLDTVLRRYFAGHTLLEDFIMQEGEKEGFLGVNGIQPLLRAQGALFDSVVIAVTDAYTHEQQDRRGTLRQRRVECIRRLLAGDLANVAILNYELDVWHMGVVATGPGAPRAIEGLAGALDRHLLLAYPGEGTVWAWLGGRRKVDADVLSRLAGRRGVVGTSLAIGEPGHGLAGWRLTHRQAAAASPIAERGVDRFVRYADLALLAASLRDPVLSASLQDLYLAPLVNERDGGEVLFAAARAFFAAGRNVSAAAAALGVSRPTIKRRLQAVEERIGRPLHTCAAEVEIALQLHELLSAAPRSVVQF